MTIEEPKFMNSGWVYVKPRGGYALKRGAPQDIKKEFKEFKRLLKHDRWYSNLFLKKKGQSLCLGVKNSIMFMQANTMRVLPLPDDHVIKPTVVFYACPTLENKP